MPGRSTYPDHKSGQRFPCPALTIFTCGLNNVIPGGATKIHLHGVKLLALHGVFPVQHRTDGLHLLHLDDGLLFLLQVIGQNAQTTVGRIVKPGRVFTRQTLNNLRIVNFMLRFDIPRTQYARFPAAVTQNLPPTTGDT